MPDNLIILQSRFENAETTRDIEKLAKETREFRKDQITGSAEWMRAAKLEAEVKNEQNELELGMGRKSPSSNNLGV